jgi:Porin subfamily
MNMVKSLLLGGAAGLAAVAGAQAADLPVKAKPVEYVKICSLYGQGFFYIPGTDTCIKLGGWVRYDQYFSSGGSGSPFVAGGAGRNESFDSQDYGTRARTVASFDVRTQTEYGVLRSYTRFGFDLTSNQQSTGGLYPERAYVQFAGFTFGKTQSYFDFAAHAWSYSAGYAGGGPDTAGYGRNLVAYEATLGNGVSFTLAAEDTTQKRGALWDAGTNSMSIGSFPGPNTLGQNASPNVCSPGSVTSDQNIGNTAAPFSVSGGCATGDYAAQSIPDIVARCGSTKAGARRSSTARCIRSAATSTATTYSRPSSSARISSPASGRAMYGVGQCWAASCSICPGTPATSSGSKQPMARVRPPT